MAAQYDPLFGTKIKKEDEQTNYMDLPIPIPFEEAKAHCEATMILKPELFEGFRFDFATQFINPKVSLSHTLMMGPTEVPNQFSEVVKLNSSLYRFGANFVDPNFMLIGQVLTDGRLYGMLKADLTDNLSIKGNAQLITNQLDMSQGMGNLEYKGRDWRSQFQFSNDRFFGLSYIQSITRRLSLGIGSELLWTEQLKKSSLGVVARYNTDKMVATGYLASTGTVALSYVQKISNRISLATDFVYNLMSRDVTTSMGYDFTGQKCRLRGKLDSNGCASASFEERLSNIPMGLNLIVSAEVDHKKKDYKFGFGFSVGY